MELKPVELNLDTDKMATQWARYNIENLREYLGDHASPAATRSLMASVHAELRRNGGHIDKVITKFLQYGRFYDMRVGRSYPIGALGRNKRKKVRWFSKTYYHEVQRFTELYAEIFKKEIPVQIASAFDIEVTGNI